MPHDDTFGMVWTHDDSALVAELWSVPADPVGPQRMVTFWENHAVPG
jgi:hypothetical protein